MDNKSQNNSRFWEKSLMQQYLINAEKIENWNKANDGTGSFIKPKP